MCVVAGAARFSRGEGKKYRRHAAIVDTRPEEFNRTHSRYEFRARDPAT